MPRTILTNDIPLTHPKRGSRSKRRIFVVTEGFSSEKKYLKALGDIIKTNIELILIARESKDSGLSAPKFVLQTILTKKDSLDFRVGDSFWMIIDKDLWDISTIAPLCEENDISLVVNNPCFEVWILFHYIQRNQINTISEFSNCESIGVKIKEFDNHFSKTRPVIKRTFFGLEKATEIARLLDVNQNNEIPENPGSRMYKLIDLLRSSD